MPRLFIGTINGRPAVKMTVDNDTAPWDIPNNHHARFKFNSDIANIGYVFAIRRFYCDFGRWPNSDNYYYEPPGSNVDSATMTIFSENNKWVQRQEMHINHSKMFGDFGFAPLVEIKNKKNGTWSGASLRHTRTYVTTNYWGGYYYGGAWGGQVTKNKERNIYETSTTVYPDLECVMAVWDLPADGTPLPSAKPNTEGQQVLIISPKLVRMAKDGFDTATSARSQLIFDGEKVPATILATGEIALGSNGTATINLPQAVSDTVFFDYMLRRSGNDYYHPPFIPEGFSEDKQFGFTYTVNGSSIILSNRGDYNLVIRYVVLHDDMSQPTSGGTKVLRTEAGFIQLKRPGSSDVAPTSKDIILDSRRTYLPLVAEGYLSRADFTEAAISQAFGSRAKTVYFDNSGPKPFKPFLKFSVVVGSTCRAPHTKQLYAQGMKRPNGYNFAQACSGTVAVVGDNYIKFHLAQGHPFKFDDDGGVPSAEFDDSEVPDGIRYYVFALPA